MSGLSEDEDRGVALMLAFQAGDDQAFDHIVAEYEGLVFGTLRRLLGPSGWVEEMAQETFIRLYRVRERYSPASKLSTFLCRIAYNLALNRIRDEKRRPSGGLRVGPEGEEMVVADAGERLAPEDDADASDWAGLVERGLQELPENQRAALVFQHYDGLGLAEIGEVLGISPKAAKSLLHRARENLREYLQPYKDAEQD
ncbi:MAG: RNA polymerase sigma factor [Planctomycetes bacterium]|nr:RNA polymerase sigma factor [Planctomycetota bacterium]